MLNPEAQAIVKFEFNGSQIDFDPSNQNLMVNATQMAKVFDKRLDHFLRSDHAKEFIKELELTPFGGSSTPLTKNEIIKTVNGVNTWMHRILALKFAAWLNPAFEVWVYSTIDQILFGDSYIRKEKLSRKAEIKKRQNEIWHKLADTPEYLELRKLEAEEIKLGKQLKSIDSDFVVRQLMLFNEEK